MINNHVLATNQGLEEMAQLPIKNIAKGTTDPGVDYFDQ